MHEQVAWNNKKENRKGGEVTGPKHKTQKEMLSRAFSTQCPLKESGEPADASC